MKRTVLPSGSSQCSFYVLSDAGHMGGLPLMYHHHVEEYKMSQTSKAWPWSYVKKKKSFLGLFVCLFFVNFSMKNVSALSLNADM